MGSLFSSCFKHEDEDSDNSGNEDSHESKEQLIQEGNTGDQVNSVSLNVSHIENVGIPSNSHEFSAKDNNTDSALNPKSFGSPDSFTPLIQPEGIPFIPEIQISPNPSNNIPTRQYDYNCEFIFDVKAVCCSVYLQCRTS